MEVLHTSVLLLCLLRSSESQHIVTLVYLFETKQLLIKIKVCYDREQ